MNIITRTRMLPAHPKKTCNDSVEILTTASGSTASDDVIMKDT